eukprot:266742-Amphidinium_carterae.1
MNWACLMKFQDRVVHGFVTSRVQSALASIFVPGVAAAEFELAGSSIEHAAKVALPAVDTGSSFSFTLIFSKASA